MKKVLPLFAIPLLFASCDSDPSCETCSSSESVKAEVAVEQPKTNADELLHALNGHVFTVKFPENLPEKFYVGLGIQHADGTVKQSGKASCSNKTKSARVFLFPSKTVSGYDYSILTENGGKTAGSLILPAYTTSVPAPQGNTVKPGDGLIRFGSEEVGSGSPITIEGNFEITLQITPFEKGE